MAGCHGAHRSLVSEITGLVVRISSKQISSAAELGTHIRANHKSISGSMIKAAAAAD